ncbi:alpha/beta fold hydrolase [Nocardioides sp. CPCC 206347]|uniref:alpha/beta fold hydrolase n=1 Tax=unclassified Nocardioides TaxID=2615069 RepID=UPI003607DE45
MTTELPDRPLVVLIHGYLDNPTVWRDVAPALEAEGFRTIAPALLADDDELTLDKFAATVVAATTAALDEDSSDGVVLVGQSMGAQVAELSARALGDGVRALVLVAPVPLGGLALPDEVAGPLRGCGGNAEIQRALRTQLSVALSTDGLEHLVRIGVDVPSERVEGWFDAWAAGDPGAAGQAPPTVPTLVLSGADDPFVNKDILGLIESRFADAVQSNLPGVGHWPHVEAPDAVAAELVSFLDSVLAAGEGGAGDVTEAAWTGAFEEKRDDSFAATLAVDVVLHASVLYRPVVGRDDVSFVMGEASQIYQDLQFVHQAQSGHLTFLEWHATTHSGIALEGVTVLERDDTGLIARVAIHHRPLEAALAFSAELRERTMTGIGDGYLWSGTARP